MTRIIIVAATLMSASADLANVAITAANAATANDRAAIRADCKNDAKKFCANVSPGQGRIRDCMQANLKDLSPACRERIDQLPKSKS